MGEWGKIRAILIRSVYANFLSSVMSHSSLPGLEGDILTSKFMPYF
jgi:hypothetical protein